MWWWTIQWEVILEHNLLPWDVVGKVVSKLQLATQQDVIIIVSVTCKAFSLKSKTHTSVLDFVLQLWRKSRLSFLLQMLSHSFWRKSSLLRMRHNNEWDWDYNTCQPLHYPPTALIVKLYKANSFSAVRIIWPPCLRSSHVLQLSNCSLNGYYLVKSWFKGTVFSFHWSSILPLVHAWLWAQFYPLSFQSSDQGNVTDICSIMVINTVLYSTTSSGYPIWIHLFVPHACY